MNPDLRKWTQMDPPDVRHETTDQRSCPPRGPIGWPWLGSNRGWPAECTCPPSSVSVILTAGQLAQVERAWCTYIPEVAL